MIKDQEGKLKTVKAEVSKAIQMLDEEHQGADLAEARRLLEEAASAIKHDDFPQAIGLAESAQLAAKPTTEYLLGRAKNLEVRGSQAYKENAFSEAIELWQGSLEEYGKAKDIALKRQESEVVEALQSTMTSIERDMDVSSRNKANSEMHSAIEEANKAADEGKTKYEAGDFDAAKVRYESAREMYGKSAKIAEAFDFEDGPKIREAEAEMSASIEACLLAEGESLIEAASKESGSAKEEAFSLVLKHIESFSSDNEMYEGLKSQAYAGIAQGRIEIGTKMMEEAEALVDKAEFYQAKERYRAAQQHLENLRDFAVEHRLENEKTEVDSFIDDCTTNIKACTDSMMGGERAKVAAGNVRKVEDLRSGIRVQPKSAGERPIEDKVSKLEKEYTSVRYLDSGGFGEVWLAQTREGQTVALKLLREPERHEDTFFREFQIWQGLVHRNIVRLLRPRVSPIPLFEMEYVDGGDLAELMKRSGPFSTERSCRIAFDVARGLEYAHSANVIHADLKPRNILLTMTEEAKITDWGLGKIATSSSRGLGYTSGYGSPEQIRREPLDRRTDAYQMGAILYEMLTGSNPFDYGSTSEKDEKALTLVPDKPSRNNPMVQPLDGVVLGCLEKDPGNRPGIRELRETLSKYMNENYGVLLQVTGHTSERVGILCRNVMFSAKLHAHGECIRALTDLKAHLSSNEAKEKVQNVIHAMEYREREKLEITDEVLNDIDAMLRLIEYGQS